MIPAYAPWRSVAGQLRQEGKSYQQIALIVGVSRQRVAVALKKPIFTPRVLRSTCRGCGFEYGKSLTWITGRHPVFCCGHCQRRSYYWRAVKSILSETYAPRAANSIRHSDGCYIIPRLGEVN